MINRLLSQLAPHHCFSCGKIGQLLCYNCKYDISYDGYDLCLNCHRLAGRNGICSNCKVAYDQAWCVGRRVEELERLIDSYKFERVKDASKVLAELLSSKLGQLPPETIIVPVPTASPHIRQRGYDHALLLAKELARLRGHKVVQLLDRNHNHAQRGASRKQRIEQARTAFVCRSTLDADTPYLLVDDIVTTGSTIDSAALVLREAGASRIMVAVVAHQSIDE